MRVGINPITNSSQRTQQKQQSFGAFTHVQPLAELMPIIRRAQAVKIDIFTPDDIIAALHQKDHVLAGMVFPRKIQKLFKQITSGHLFNASERDRMLNEAECGFNNVRLEAEEIMKDARGLPIGTLENTVAKIERETQVAENTDDEVIHLSALLNDARLRNTTAKDIISNELTRLRELGF